MSESDPLPGRILLTGCAGFIGSNVAALLLSLGYQVDGIDNLNDAYDVRLKQWRLAQLEGRAGFAFHPLDIGDRDAIAKLFVNRNGYQAVVNLAARAGVRQSVENPWVYIQTNVVGTLNLLELCREHGVKKFVLASTSSLYGEKTPRPFREDASTDSVLSPYAASKKSAEVMCFTYHYLYGLDVSILRYFTVYGPAGRPDMSLFRFVQWISEGTPLILFGDGRQERDFSYVGDIAAGTVAALRPMGYEVINLGSDHPVAINDAISLIEELVGRTAVIDSRKPHPADVRATWADITKAGALLDWRPQTAFNDGVSRLVAWYRENRDWARTIATAEPGGG